MSQRKKVTIFEGADGSGKSTTAHAFAELTGARYVHCSNWKHVTDGLPRLYLEAMLPALLGYQDVVLDRCWLSEQPYGKVYRSGEDRLGTVYRRMLERVAMSCGAIVVRCDPGPEICVENWWQRRREENKGWENSDGLRDVVNSYRNDLRTELSILDYDYTRQPRFFEPGLIDSFRSDVHETSENTAGDITQAKIALVGQDFAELKNQDCLSQYPFVSFSQQGCSAWLTQQLESAGIPEWKLFWANADMVSPEYVPSVDHIIALGQAASDKLGELGYTHHTVAHPQHAKRFKASQPYELVTLIKELL